jgi:glycosyltransferase involved in cell wall biosynthesis
MIPILTQRCWVPVVRTETLAQVRSAQIAITATQDPARMETLVDGQQRLDAPSRAVNQLFDTRVAPLRPAPYPGVAADPRIAISVIVPAKNEVRNLPILIERLHSVLRDLGERFEIIVVNDGSTDGSLRVLRELSADRAELRVIDLARNYGQTAAMMAGIDHSTGDIIVPIDADLQNDPADIPRLLAKLDEGYDVVSGWRKDRKDAALRRNFVSRVANTLISRLSGVRLHDYGCSLKAYRRDVLGPVRLYGEMHRFVPIYASWYGARIAEVPVNHSPRLHGSSNYGLERVLKVALDLMVVRFLDRWIGKPIYVFGGFGLLWFVVSAMSATYMMYLKFFGHVSMILTPLPMLAVMAFMMGVTSISIGLVAEIVVRTYFESQGKSIYHVRETINLHRRYSPRHGP